MAVTIKRQGGMWPYLAHARKCDVCRANPRLPCPIGYELFQKGADHLARVVDPRKAKA